MPKENDRFWCHFLNIAGARISFILVINVIYLAFVVYLFGCWDGFIDNQSKIKQESFQAIVLYTLNWIILNLLIIASLFIIRYKKNSFYIFGVEYNNHKLWRQTGYIILLTRVLFLISSLISGIFQKSSCFTMVKQLDDGSFNIPFIVMLIDASQLMLLPSAMFPSPWVFLFSGLELTSNISKLLSCRGRLADLVPRHNNFALTLSYIIAVLSIIISVTAWSFEEAARRLFDKTLEQNKFASNKRLVIELLCTELKLPLQLIIDTLDVLRNYKHIGSSGELVMTKLTEATREIRILADDLLLLIRIEEGRFEFNKSCKINVPNLLAELLQFKSNSSQILEPIISHQVSEFVDEIYSDEFVIRSIINNMYCLALHLLRISKYVDVNIDVDRVYISQDLVRIEDQPSLLQFKFSHDSRNSEAYSYFHDSSSTIYQTLSSLANIGQGSIKYADENHTGNDFMIITISCLYNDSHINLSSTGPLRQSVNAENAKIDSHTSIPAVTYQQDRFNIGLLISDINLIVSMTSKFESIGFKCSGLIMDDSSKLLDIDAILIDRKGLEILSSIERKTTKFLGVVILLTGDSSYVDNRTSLVGYDFMLLALPCSNTDIEIIKERCMISKLKQRNTSISFNAIDIEKLITQEEGRLSLTMLMNQVNVQVVKTISYFINLMTRSDERMTQFHFGSRYKYSRTIFGMNIFANDVEDELHHWRLTNPEHLCSHTSFIVDITIIAIYFLLRIAASIVSDNFLRLGKYNLGFSIFILIMIFRAKISSWLGIKLGTYWLGMGLLQCLFFLFNIYVVGLDHDNNSANVKDVTAGVFTIFGILIVALGSFHVNHMLWGLFLPWPFGMITTFIVVLQYRIIIKNISMYMPNSLLYLVNATLIHSMMAAIILIYRSEFWSRATFKVLKQNEHAIQFIEGTTENFWKGLQAPMQDIVRSRIKLLESLQIALLEGRLIMNSKLYLSLKSFHLGNILHEEILNSFIIDTSLKPKCCGIALESELCYIVKAFESSKTARIETYVMVHPEISYIQIEKWAFHTLLVSCLQIAREHINAKILENGRLHDSVNEILVVARFADDVQAAIESASNVNEGNSDRNTLSKLICLDIMDTGSILSNNQQKKLTLNKRTNKKMVLRLNGFYHHKCLMSSNYRNIQTITIPFLAVETNDNVQLKPASKGDIRNANYLTNKFIAKLKALRLFKSSEVTTEISNKLSKNSKKNSDEINHLQREYLSYENEDFKSMEYAAYSTDLAKFHALFFNFDTPMLDRYQNVLSMNGWDCTLANSVNELLSNPLPDSISIIVIDDFANRCLMKENDLDLVYELKLRGFYGPIVSLTFSLGEMHSSKLFDDSISKPFIDSSVNALRTIVLRRLFGEILSIQESF